ncbi:hypothetical protein, conserved [Trypanosoma brucei brucei TREU927]|uniref:Uncharacterized protein n=1 Tax=Trypanosoma brucei brucei (strain 927/4 GUTat10.1) TaxID=185431 RepID=Q57UI2_TRYB2|nr:hypothetical protein, conserved [Trypanosoma brucei brucei TREU927]AAX70749.1 hypothetical protein, conserved [Trypanosoma brucei]AAZ13274.1 hypothetical protein, conserved [Trypanosoma brucei brucei TREU927]
MLVTPILRLPTRRSVAITHGIGNSLAAIGLRKLSSAASNRKRGSNSDSDGATARRDGGLLLLQLKWRAKELLLAEYDKKESQKKPQILQVHADGTFDVEWRNQLPHKASSAARPTEEERVTLLCQLLAVTVKERCGRGAQDCFFASFPTDASVLLPARAAEAVVAPFGRQARLWEEQHEWQAIVSCAAKVFGSWGIKHTKDSRDARRRGSYSNLQLRTVVRNFVDKVESLCSLRLGASREMAAKGRQKRTKRPKMSEGGDVAEDGLTPDTMLNTLYRLAVLLRLLSCLFERCEGQVGSVADCEHLKEVVHCILSEIESRRFIVVGLDGSSEAMEGLAALVLAAFGRNCGGIRAGGSRVGSEVHWRAYKGEFSEALLLLCSAYLRIVPARAVGFELESSGTGSEPTSISNSETISVVRALHQCWDRWKATIHVHGSAAAFWWLRLVPLILEALLDATEKMSNSRGHKGDADSRESQVKLLQSELLATLCGMLYFDEERYNERMTILSARQAAEEAKVGQVGNGGDGDNPTNATPSETEADDAHGLTRPRAGRSMLRKGQEGGVLLPSSSEALRKSSRFLSRRTVGDSGGGVGANTNAGTALMDVGVNSPLFDLLATSDDAVSELSSLFAIEKMGRSCTLENLWLILLAAHRHLRPYRTSSAVCTHEGDGELGKEANNFFSGDEVVVEANASNGKSPMTLAVPAFVLASIQHLATTLACAVVNLYDLSDPSFLRDDNIRRAVSIAIVAGTQELLLRSRFYSDALLSNWWLRSGVSSAFGEGQKSFASLENHMMALVAQRTRYRGRLGWVKESTRVALHCLSSMPLSPLAKQWAASLVVCNLRDVTFLLRNQRVGISSSTAFALAKGTLTDSAAAADVDGSERLSLDGWARETFTTLLATLTADVELVLLCGYAGFIDTLFEMHMRIGTNQEEMMRFGDDVLLNVNLAAVLASLSKSATDSDAETHAATCESALFVLAEFSRFASWPNLDNSSVLRTDGNSLLIRVAVYCLRHARRAGGKRPSGYGLPAPHLPEAGEMVEKVLSTCGPTLSFLLARGNRCSYLQVLDLSNRLLPFSRVQPLYGGRESSCVAALQHYLRGSHHALLSMPSSSTPTGPTVAANISGSGAASQKQLLEESLKRLNFMANTTISTHVLGYLVRFVEHYLREQERCSRSTMEDLPTTTTGCHSPSLHGDENVAADRSKEQRESAMVTLARVEAAPLVLLDYMGYLSCAGSWAMVNWTFNLAETSLKIQRKHQIATTTSVVDVAVGAILSQLRAVVMPATPQIPSNMPKSLICLCDMISESPVTLLGFDRGSPLQGILKQTSRGDYRAMLFAMKQAVLLVQRASAKYRTSAPHSPNDASGGEKNDEASVGGDDRSGAEVKAYFSMPVGECSPDDQRQLRLFLECLLMCFDDVLDAIRWCALQQDVLDDELRDVLLLELQTLIRILRGCLRTVLLLSPEQKRRFHGESAQLLWVSLCVASAIGKVASVDYGRICFSGTVMHSVAALLDGVERLVKEHTVSGAHKNKQANKKEPADVDRRSGGAPLMGAIELSLNLFFSDALMSHRLALRLGLGLRERSDFTALATALRTLASAAARYEPAGRIVQFVWRTLCEELVNTVKPVKRKGRGSKATKEPSAGVKVPSKDELKLLLDSFNDLQNEVAESVASRQSKGRAAEYVVEWACPDAQAVLDSVVEDPSVLRGDRWRKRETNSSDPTSLSDSCEKEEEEQSLADWSATIPTTAVPGAVAAFMEMDAALLLEDGGNVTNEEALEAFLRQCSRLHLSSTVVASNDSNVAIPQTNKVILIHFGCVMAIVERCTLAEIASFPRGELVFGSLHLFYRPQTPVPLEKLHMLWLKLGERWNEEFIIPDCKIFERQQQEFLQLVRQRRALFQPSERGMEDTAGSHPNDHEKEGLLLRDSVIARLARQNVPPLPYDVEMLPHDGFSALDGGFTALSGSSQQFKDRLPFRIPLDALLTLLHDFSRAPRGETPLEEFAKGVITYVARQHVLLRERCDGHAVNVLQFMPQGQQFSSRVYQRRRLPLVCAHAPSVTGWFFDEAEGEAIKRLFAQAAASGGCTRADKTGAGGEDAVGNLVRSAEHGMFEYLRALCLYLHLLALTANVCHHFRILGSSGEMSDVHSGVVVGRSHNRYGFEEENKDSMGWRTTRGKGTGNEQQDANVRLSERRVNADARQADPEGVNANLLENILLHFMNVSLAVIGHADSVTHRAASIAVAPGCDEERARRALFYADELRLMVAVAVQDSLRVLLREAPVSFSLARRVTHRIISSFSCEEIPLTPLDGDTTGEGSTAVTGGASKDHNNSGFGRHIGDEKQVGGALSELPQIDRAELTKLRLKRPELLLRSPTLLCILSPSFFNEVLSQHVRNAISLTVTQVVASLRFYLRGPDARLGPLMSATASILASTYVRNAALRLFCEELCGQIVDRDDFRDALAPQTVASGQQGVVAPVPNEVLIPFLAAIAREDACVTKNALALVLHRAMSLRPDVFGQPPTEDRFSRLAIARRGSGIATPSKVAGVGSDGMARDRLSLGVSTADVVLERPAGAGTSPTRAECGEDIAEIDLPTPGTDDEEWDEVTALNRFKVNQAEQEITRTHKRALASLNLTLAEVMETAMHFSTMRRLTSEEHKKATAMIRSADDARHERVAAFRSATPPATTGSITGKSSSASVLKGDGGEERNIKSSDDSLTIAGHPDAALNIDEPTNFGVAMLHISFALRKIIHVSMRRLAAQQGPKTLCMMVEMLREVDPKWHHGPNDEHRRQLDSMLVGTLRVLVARALVCADAVGGADDLMAGGASGVAMSLAGLQRTERALYLVQHLKNGNRGGSAGPNVAKSKCTSRGVSRGASRDLRRQRPGCMAPVR